MSKFAKNMKKGKLWSIVLAVVLLAAAVVCTVFGVNKSTSMTDCNTLTVSMNRYVYNTKLDVVKDECENAFGDLNAKYTVSGDMSGDDCEIVFVFDADVDLSAVKETIKNNLNAKTQEGCALEGAFINVTTGSEIVLASSAKGTVVRAVIALAVFAVLAFAYVAVRYHVGAGIVAAIATVLGSVVSTAIVLLVRIPVTNSLVYVGAIGGLLSVAFTTLTLAKSRSANTEDAAEAVESSVPAKEINMFTVLAVAALVIVAVASVIAAGTFSTAAWFAFSAVFAVATAWFLSIVYMPALYVPFKQKALENASKNEYKGAKKTSTKVKKSFVKQAAPVEEAPVEEAPVEETPVEEAPVEEAPVEEAPVEEAPVEEAPVEETEPTEAE